MKIFIKNFIYYFYLINYYTEDQGPKKTKKSNAQQVVFLFLCDSRRKPTSIEAKQAREPTHKDLMSNNSSRHFL